jgi:Family of unknown function (DUF6496)
MAGGTTGRRKIKKVMHEYKHGSLRSSTGGRVRSKRQAVAIALSEARHAGARIPQPGSASRRRPRKSLK